MMTQENETGVFIMRDEYRISYRCYSYSQPQAILLLLPGFGLSGEDYVSCCQHLVKSSAAIVYSPGLRGLGDSQCKPGDVDYIGQLQDDLSDMIETILSNHPGIPLVLAAHSGSSSLAISYLASKPTSPVAALYLVAPVFFGHMEYYRHIKPAYHFIHYGRYHRKPCEHPTSKFEVRQQFRYSLLRHSIGATLKPLQKIRVLRVRRDAEQPWRSYSYRFLQSYCCHHLEKTLEHLTLPVYVMAGYEDEVMLPDAVFSLLNWHLAPGILREAHCVSRMGHFSILVIASTLIGLWLRNTIATYAGGK
ncbi:alpha/beta hydrolase [Xenorhabdus kozodoii]|uniref:Serine aminopeptidase S33 domain-containing protein n=1 Tax=Xenorhabdus kozodoii TaxID=351676 RepID=A0A2D0L4J9_9GAMM|nr:alpha/beta fold hydrolase [Xenorhabdus kozodoii]PHM70609.1 hypothetical protein Xkoz_03049 [Xenorhabdus kozodoii]